MSILKYFQGQTPEDQALEREAEWEQACRLKWYQSERWLLILRPKDQKVPPQEERIELWKKATYPHSMRR